MSSIPHAPSFDSSISFLKEGYPFISRICDRLNTDIFQTRLFLKRAYCLRGAEAAEMFYSSGHLTRRGAMPPGTVRLLQGKDSVQALDGTAHQKRKALFLNLLSDQNVSILADYFEQEWIDQLNQWKAADQIDLLSESAEILCRTICRWAGLPLNPNEVAPRTRELSAMIDGAGSFGLRNLKGIFLRRKTERWARKKIKNLRNRKRPIDPESPIGAIMSFKNSAGENLSDHTVTTELLNLLRPTVAVGRFITFIALALHEHPHAKTTLDPENESSLEHFVQEVRRFYPFFPVIAGRTIKPFNWKGFQFPENAWLILDLYGTNRDPRLWKNPNEFHPGRFRNWNVNLFSLIPQGAGKAEFTHRCPGESLTIELMKRTTKLLLTRMHYEVPEQDLTVNLTRFPAQPESSFKIDRIRDSEAA